MRAIAFLIITFLCGCEMLEKKPINDELIGDSSALYSEKYRPQFHFSPQDNWMNDPNGMVYYQDEYHLFYQYHPESTVWGPMHWGHAISKDLVHWEQFPIALYPDEHGTIFSGSAVVDWNNTSGFGTKDNPPLVAIYTYHNAEGEKLGKIDFQTQGIAYSLDKGRTWIKYSQNPVMANPGIKDFRDPKVSWHQESQKWVMVLAQDDHIGIYSSPNLIDWQLESNFGKEWGVHAGVWECPDLIKMPIEGTNEFKYALLVSINPGGPNGGSATQYFIGDFDGKTFTLTSDFEDDVKPITVNNEITESGVWLDYGTDNYAGVTFSDVSEEDGRRLFIGWMSNWLYANQVPTEKWRSAMTIPRALTIVKTNVGLRVASTPVEELSKIVKQKEFYQKLSGESNYNLVNAHKNAKLHHLEFDVNPLNSNSIKLIFDNELGEKTSIDLDISSGEILLDRSLSGDISFDSKFANIQKAITTPRLSKYRFNIYVDTSSFEIFVNDGETVITSIVFPTKPYSSVNIEADSEITLENITIGELKSIW